MNNVVVIGMGYVGLSYAVMLSQKNNVTVLDIDRDKIDLLNKKKSPIKDADIEFYLKNMDLRIHAEYNEHYNYSNADLVIVALPTNYSEVKKTLNTEMIEDTINLIRNTNDNVLIIIKSTLPIGFMAELSQNINCTNIIFSPEFLREGQALHDVMNPTRIILGTLTGESSNEADIYISMLREVSGKTDSAVMVMNYTEAEAVKIFSNAYLAMRVSFFNELDTYAEYNRLNSRAIIEGVCMDPRIASGYNNPSFGYGGYCLPKDTKQLLADYKNIPQNIIKAIVDSNATRKKHIANQVMDRLRDYDRPIVGVYRLQMKSGSDNARESGILDVISILLQHGIKIKIYEPFVKKEAFNMDCDFEDDLDAFKKDTTIIIANRMSEELYDVMDKVYTRDIFNYS